MGQHAEFCAITKRPITGGECVAIWTERSKYESLYEPNIINSIAHFGEYDTYGRLENATDKEYLEHMSEEEMDENVIFLDKDVYNSVVSFSVNNWGDSSNSGSVFANGDLTIRNLKSLGFIELEEKSKDKRYDIILVHPEYPNSVINSDKTWLRLYLNGGKEAEHGVYSFREFSEFFPSLDYSSLKNKCFILDIVENAYESYSQQKAIFKLEDEYLNHTLIRELGITDKIIPYLEKPYFREKLAEVIKVRRFMTANNIKFGYRFRAGPQEGNYDAHAKLVELMNIVHNKNIEEIARQKAEWGDD